jgi:hypothetical protein
LQLRHVPKKIFMFASANLAFIRCFATILKYSSLKIAFACVFCCKYINSFCNQTQFSGIYRKY